MYPTTTAPLLPDYFTSAVQHAVQCQQQIGWYQLFHGRLSIQWGHIIGSHLASQRISDKEMTPDIWGKTIVKMIFRFVLDIWIQRNLDGHHLNNKHELQLSRDRILQKIRSLQESNPEVRYCDRDFVYCPIDTLEKHSLANLLSWHRAAVSIVKNQKQYRIRHPSVREFFPLISSRQQSNAPAPPPEPDPVPFVPYQHPNALSRVIVSTLPTFAA